MHEWEFSHQYSLYKTEHLTFKNTIMNKINKKTCSKQSNLVRPQNMCHTTQLSNISYLKSALQLV